MKKLIFFLFISLSVAPVSAQCPMCKTTVENSQNGEGKNLNKAIVYLLLTPFLIGIVGGGIFYYNYRNEKRKAELNINNPNNF
jgi:K+-transporting ATPase A subunit